MISRNNVEEQTIQVTAKCPMCGAPSAIELPRDGYLAWVGGRPFDTALGFLDQETKELLVTGICTGCWTRMFEGGEAGAQQLIHFIADGVKRRSEAAGLKTRDSGGEEL